MNTFINPVSGRVHTRFTVILSAWHTHGIALEEASRDLDDLYHSMLNDKLRDILNGDCVTPCSGVYDGISAACYLCDCHDIVEVMHLFELGSAFNQECILVVDHRAETVGLLYMDGQVSRIGKNLDRACRTVKGDYTQIGAERYVVA